MRLVEGGVALAVVVVHVDSISTIGRQSSCDKFGADLNKYVPITNLRERRSYAGCRFERDRIHRYPYKFPTGVR